MKNETSVSDAVYSFFPNPCFLLSGLSPAERDEALAVLRPTLCRYAEGDTVVSSGEAGGRLFFLLSGRCSVYRTGGEKPVLMNQLRSGDCFGAASLFSNDSTPTEIVAETDCRCAIVREPELSRLFSTHPVAALNYIRFISEKLVFLNRRVRDFSAASSDEKTAALILNQADENGVAVFRSVTALIRTMNLSRASFYRSLSSFVSRGMIERHRNAVKILNLNELKGILS